MCVVADAGFVPQGSADQDSGLQHSMLVTSIGLSICEIKLYT